jgi:hypothetical protein
MSPICAAGKILTDGAAGFLTFAEWSLSFE